MLGTVARGLRLFTALTFDEKTRAAARAVQDELRRHVARGTWPGPESFHLTLCFLGSVPEERLAELESVLLGVEVPRFEVSFERVGRLSGCRRAGCRTPEGDTWVLEAAPAPQLMAVQKDLELRLAGAGFATPSRAFKPHLTLGRRVVPALEDDAIALEKPVRCAVDSFALLRTEFTGQGPVYHEVLRVGASDGFRMLPDGVGTQVEPGQSQM